MKYFTAVMPIKIGQLSIIATEKMAKQKWPKWNRPLKISQTGKIAKGGQVWGCPSVGMYNSDIHYTFSITVL